MFGFGKPVTVNAETALSGRDTPVLDASRTHRIFGEPLNADHPGAETAYFALGCFWGAEKLFWKQPGVLSTAGAQGEVDAAIYARPHFVDQETVAFIMADMLRIPYIRVCQAAMLPGEVTHRVFEIRVETREKSPRFQPGVTVQLEIVTKVLEDRPLPKR